MNITNYVVDFSSWFVLTAVVGSMLKRAVELSIDGINDIKLDSDKMISDLKSSHKLADKTYDEKTINTTLQYNRIQSVFHGVCGLIKNPIVMTLSIIGLQPFLLDWMSSCTFFAWAGIPEKLSILAVCGIILTQLIDTPFELFSDRIEKKYGYSNMTVGLYVSDTIKSILISCIFSIGGIYIIYYALAYLGKLNFFTAAAFVTGFMALSWIVNILYLYFVYPMFNKFTPIEDGELKSRLKAVVEDYGCKFENVYIMDESRRSTKGNAFCISIPFGPNKIVLFDTLVKDLTTDEIVAIFAHEFGHKKLKHCQIFEIIGYVRYMCFICFAIMFMYDTSIFHAFGYRFVTDQNILEYSIIGLSLAGTVVEGITWILTPAMAWISRKFEYAADNTAIEYMKSGDPLATGLIKLYATSGSDCIVTNAYEKYFCDHPSLLNRIKNTDKSNG